jgi:hypothetical protein
MIYGCWRPDDEDDSGRHVCLLLGLLLVCSCRSSGTAPESASGRRVPFVLDNTQVSLPCMVYAARGSSLEARGRCFACNARDWMRQRPTIFTAPRVLQPRPSSPLRGQADASSTAAPGTASAASS